MGVQMLPHFYAEDLVNVMNKERRREALAKFVGIIKADIEREKKGRAGVENLAKALHETPKFGGEESQVRAFFVRVYFSAKYFPPGGGCGEASSHAVHDDLSGGQQVQGAERDDGPGVSAPGVALPLFLHRLQQGQAGPDRRHPQDPLLGQA